MIFFLHRRPQTNRKLWEKSNDKWFHDMYNEDEQGPKTREERMVRLIHEMFSFHTGSSL